MLARAIPAAALLALIAGCTGPVGPQGPAAPGAGVPDGAVVQGLVVQHDSTDDAANRTGILHVRARGVTVAGRSVTVADDVDIAHGGLGGLESRSAAVAAPWD